MSNETEPATDLISPDGLRPFQLPPILAEFLRGQDLACVTESTNAGTAYVLKAPAADIDSLRGAIPIHVMHELHRLPMAPVIRTVIRLYDRPESSLAFESFINVSDEGQRANFAGLRAQEELLLLFYDEELTHRLSKRVGLHHPEVVDELLTQAATHRASIPDDLFDFDAAEAEVINATGL